MQYIVHNVFYVSNTQTHKSNRNYNNQSTATKLHLLVTKLMSDTNFKFREIRNQQLYGYTNDFQTVLNKNGRYK